MKKLPVVALFATLIATNSFADDLAMRGWFYYQDPMVETQQTESPPQKLYKNYRDYNAAIQQEFEEIQDRAIYDQTPENIQAYNQALRSISNNAVRFGMLTVTQNWQDPNAGISQTAPNGAGLQLDLDKQRQQIGQIVKRYALFYFISKDCKYCSVQANELKRLELTYNIAVRVISLDGSTLSQYPTPTSDKGISTKLGVQETGELMAFDTTNNKTTVLGFGYIHFDQIVQRLQTLFITGTANWDQYQSQKQPILLNRDNQ
ncbi:MAG: conjugal transfer protein TraF [Burkholderiales bacterium]|nr:conjugal transfer protein TraF [Burkholderiales bacterium]